jgi:hypothetical protein
VNIDLAWEYFGQINLHASLPAIPGNGQINGSQLASPQTVQLGRSTDLPAFLSAFSLPVFGDSQIPIIV